MFMVNLKGNVEENKEYKLYIDRIPGYIVYTPGRQCAD